MFYSALGMRAYKLGPQSLCLRACEGPASPTDLQDVHASLNEVKPSTKAEQIIPPCISSHLTFICAPEHTMYLKSAQLQEPVTSHQMSVITNLLKNNMSRAELMKDTWAYFLHFMQGSLGCWKLSWKAIDFALEQMRKPDSRFGCGSSDNLSAASFLSWH